jgi:hypothetical protein
MVGSTPIASGRQNDEGDGICGHGVGDTERVERREAERAFIVVPLCGGGRHSQAKPPPPTRPQGSLLTFDCASTCSVVWMRLLEYLMEELHTDSIDGGHEASYGARSRARERAYSNKP